MKKENKKGANGSKISKILGAIFGRIFTKIFLIAVLGATLFFGGKYGWMKLGEIKTEKSSAIVFRELEKCAELVSVKTTYSDVISIKKTRIAGFAKSFSIIKYTGVIRGGIADISKAKFSVYDRGSSVKVSLPHSEILSNDISNIEVFDESRSIFVEISINEIMQEIRFNQESASADIIGTGFLEEADSQAAKLIESLLYAAGFDKVVVE